jgi:hypothetical protein
MAATFSGYAPLFALLVVLSLTGCMGRGGRTPLPQGDSGTNITNTDGLFTFADDADGLDSNAQFIVQGAFDDSKDDLSQTQAPTSVGQLSQQQQFCSSATPSSAQGFDFFSQLGQPSFAGSSNACFAGPINPLQLLAQNYTQIRSIEWCQAIALAALQQTPQTPENMAALFFWVSGFLFCCVMNSVAVEGAYMGPLSQGVQIRQLAVRNASNLLRQALRKMGP